MCNSAIRQYLILQNTVSALISWVRNLASQTGKGWWKQKQNTKCGFVISKLPSLSGLKLRGLAKTDLSQMISLLLSWKVRKTAQGWLADAAMSVWVTPFWFGLLSLEQEFSPNGCHWECDRNLGHQRYSHSPPVLVFSVSTLFIGSGVLVIMQFWKFHHFSQRETTWHSAGGCM